jgi:hypothetical protein
MQTLISVGNQNFISWPIVGKGVYFYVFAFFLKISPTPFHKYAAYATGVIYGFFFKQTLLIMNKVSQDKSCLLN